MTEKELIERLARMGPTNTQVDRMLERIMNPATAKLRLRWNWSWSIRIAVPALLCMLMIGIGLPLYMNGDEEPAWVPLKPIVSPTPMAVSIGPRAVGLSLDVDVRKFLNYNGSRYEFLNNGQPYDLSELKLGEHKPLGKLDYDIAADMQAGGSQGYASRDFGTTYLAGGIVYELTGYKPSFRLAVEQNGRYYVVQVVGRTDESIMEANDYVEAAQLDKLADRFELMDSSSKLLHTWTIKKDIHEMVKRIASFEAAGKLTNEQYEQLAKATNLGENHILRAVLKDGTVIDMLLTPEMGLIAIGDGRYKLSEEWLAAYSDLLNP